MSAKPRKRVLIPPARLAEMKLAPDSLPVQKGNAPGQKQIHRKIPKFPWDAVREEYEGTAATSKSLARQFGTTRASIETRARRDGWKRDVGKIAADLAREGASMLESGGPIPEVNVPPQHPKIARRARMAEKSEESDARNIRVASSLAQQHIIAVARQLRAAGDARELADLILDRLKTILRGPPDPFDHDSDENAEYRAARMALVVISPDKEKLADLARAATTILREASRMERVALGMDIRREPDNPEPAQLRNIKQAMSQLPPDALMRLREVAADIRRLPPAAAPALAEPEPEPAQ